jgi:hypothetical protein
MRAANAKATVLMAFVERGIVQPRVKPRRRGVNGVARFTPIRSGRDLTDRAATCKVSVLMTTASTRTPAQLLMQLAGACALILFVVILILPH